MLVIGLLIAGFCTLAPIYHILTHRLSIDNNDWVITWLGGMLFTIYSIAITRLRLLRSSLVWRARFVFVVLAIAVLVTDTIGVVASVPVR